MKSFKEFITEAAASQLLMSNPHIQHYEKNKFRMSDQEKESTLSLAYDSLLPKFNAIKGQLQNLITKGLGGPKPHGPSRPKILIGIKPLNSAFSKIIKRNKSAYNIGDFVRCAVLFDSGEQVADFLKDFRRKNRNIIADYESKEKGSDPSYGYYGSHHLDLSINGLTCEMQVMTKKLWSFKSEAHTIYNKYRDSGGVPDKFDQYNSKKIFSLGNKPKFTKEECELFEDFAIGMELTDDVESV